MKGLSLSVLSLLKPDAAFRNIYNITPELLFKFGIKALVLDIDDTLIAKKSNIITKELINWVYTFKENDIPIYIISNNFKKRVMPISDKLGVPFIYFALKPFPKGINKARKIFKVTKKDVCIIGDQIFTDVISGKLAGVFTVLVDPISTSHSITIKLKRFLEKKIRRKLKYYDEYK